MKAFTALLLKLWILLGIAFSAVHAQSAGARPPASRDSAQASLDSSIARARGPQSWTSDRVRLGLGDIITVLIDERTLASARLNENAADQRSKNLGLSATPPAAAGAPPSITAASASFGADGDSRRQGESTRENGFRSEMSARVVAVSPTGMLKVTGKKMVNVDKNRQEVTVTGWVRPQDIASATNAVESWRLADAEIVYGQQGKLGKPKAGLLGKLLGAIWP